VMVAVSLYDTLSFRQIGEGFSVVCPDMPLLCQNDNLVTKAAQAIMEVSGATFDVEVTLSKAIPVGGGMGGGSSDAAATLLALNEMLVSEKRQGPRQLIEIAAGIGSDVPFFLGCDSAPPAWSAALCVGAGSDVHPLPDPKEFALVLAVPKFSSDTAQAYRDWDRFGGLSVPSHEGCDKEMEVMQALLSGDSDLLAKSLVNDLEPVVSLRYPAISGIERLLLDSGALGAAMTGSGSSVFGVCSSFKHAEEVAGRMRERAKELDLASVLPLRMGCVK